MQGEFLISASFYFLMCLPLLDNFVLKFMLWKRCVRKNSLYHGLRVSVIIEDTFQFTVNAKYNICFGKQFIQNGGNICFKQGIIV